MPSDLASTTAAEIFPQNRLRKSFVVQNEDATINIFIQNETGNTVSSTVHAHRLGAGGALALNFQNDGERAIQDRWTIIAASGTPRYSWFETEDVVR